MSTDIAWEAWGARDPYYGVLTQPEFRAGALTAEGRELFFASGRAHVAHVLDVLRRQIDETCLPRRVLDFGCGVGRVLLPFAEVVDEAVGVDVSPSMLGEAQRNCEARALSNVRLLPSDDTLSSVEGSFDLVHSCIVLQHIEVTRGRALFAELVRRVRPGGCGALHVTIGWDAYADTFGQPPPLVAPPPRSLLSSVKATLRQWLPGTSIAPPEPAPQTEAEADPEMQMNYYNLSELVFILQRAGAVRFHTELTDHGGAIGAFLFFQIGR